jgi:hypothetical protein
MKTREIYRRSVVWWQICEPVTGVGITEEIKWRLNEVCWLFAFWAVVTVAWGKFKEQMSLSGAADDSDENAREKYAGH